MPATSWVGMVQVGQEDRVVSEDVHAVLCTDTAPALQWQCELLEHTWSAVGQPGDLVRLVAAPDDEPLPVHAIARVLRTPPSNVHPVSGDAYIPYNRLYSLATWLERERPRGTVLVLDPDMVFRAPLPLRAASGAPVAQRWVDFGDGRWLADRMAVPRSRLQPATWPLAIRTEDLQALLPRWIERTAEVRARTQRWESDMFALVLAAADLDLGFELTTTCAWMPWPEADVRGAALVHYCQVVEGAGGAALWSKRDYRPWDPIGDPGRARLAYCRDLLAIVDAYARRRREASPTAAGAAPPASPDP